MFALTLTLTLLCQAPVPPSRPPPTSTQASYQRQIERRHAKAISRARFQHVQRQQEEASETYYREHILPAEHRRAIETTHAQADLMRANGNLQRPVAGYPVPGLNPYTGMPLGQVTGPRFAIPGVNFP